MLEATETIFQYNGSPIAFQKGDSVMINATEMAKPFGKSATHWLRNQSTQEFLNTYATLRNRNVGEMVKIINGGDRGNGTWMHEDVALEFARWLSPAFAIWCNDRIKELLTQGVATIANDDEAILHAMEVLRKRVEKGKQQLQAARTTIDNQAQQLTAQAPKVAFAEAIITSNTSCLIGELAKLITQNGVTIGQNRLFAWMREHGYLGKHGERRNIPNQQYVEQGLFELKKGVRSGNGGVMHTTLTPKVTGKGQQYFIGKFLSQGQSSCHGQAAQEGGAQ